MPSAELELSIVMPCLNEAATLGMCIDKAFAFLARRAIAGEVVIADNGSSDASRAIALARGATVVEVSARGYGSALKGGFSCARGRYVIMGDADDSYDFSTLDAFVSELRAGADLVLGDRFAGGIEPGAMPPLHRYLGNPVLSGVGRVLFKNGVRDFHCGLRGFRRSAIAALELQTTGMEFASEMIVKAHLYGLRVAEVPTKLARDGRAGPAHLRSWHDGWRHLRFLLVYSPRWLFLYPGALLLTIGIVSMAALLPHPLYVGRHRIDVNTLLYSGACVLLGIQSIVFSFLTKIFGADAGLLPVDERFERLLERMTLERGLLLGGALIAIGFAGSLIAFFQWGLTSFGDLNESTIARITVPSVTSLAAGGEIMFASFFMSILRIGRSGKR